MFLSSKKFLSLAALLTVTVAAEAQTFSYAIQTAPVFYLQPVLPALQTKFGNFDKSIGNSWLGGNVHAYAGMVRQKSGTYELGNAQAEFRAEASVLQASLELAEIVGNATNVMNGGVQSRSGYYRVDLLGYTIVNGSFANDSTFGAATSTFNLLGPNGVSASVPVGPISVTLKGNAGCSFSRSANWLLPAATASVGLNASGGAYANANASVGFGIPGFGVGVGIQGKILEQSLTASVTASAGWGLSGGVSYSLKAITLSLYAYAEAFWQEWTHNLCSWSTGLVTLNLL